MNRLASRCVVAAALILALAGPAAAEQAPARPPTDPIESAIDTRHAAAMASYGRPVAWWLQRPGAEPERRDLNLPGDTPVLPASTIKPLLTLVALETGVLSGADEVLPWDGRPYANPQWQKPSALNEAMANSNESYFRTLAERIGRDRLAQWIARVGYGNGQFGKRAAEFHDGVLLITARQQLEFVDRLGRGDLPFAKDHLATVRASMRETVRGDVEVFGKTGTFLRGDRDAGIGWWVGWVERHGETIPFALRVGLDDIDGRDKRIALGLRLLEIDGVLPAR